MSKAVTVKEWYRCLTDSEHAKTTCLRIEPKHERAALIIFSVVIAILLIANGFVWLRAYHRLQTKRMYEEYYRTHQVEQLHSVGARIV